MDLIVSALLLASFVVGVDVLVDGGADLATRFGGLFRAPGLPWPAGVQEADIRAWVEPDAGAPAGEHDVAPEAAAEIVDGGRAVQSLSRVRRR